MTPEEAGIYSADSHMRHLVNWMIDNDVVQFKIKDLPEQFSRALHLKSIVRQHIERNGKKNCQASFWKPAGIYANALVNNNKMHVSQCKNNGLTIEAVRDSIANGMNTPLDMAKHLSMSQSATYRALRKYHAAGKLERTTINNYLHYTIKEA